jgi:hypothetical protein
MRLDKMVNDGYFSIGKAFTLNDNGKQLVLTVSKIKGTRIQLKYVVAGGQDVVFESGEVTGPIPLVKSSWGKVLGLKVSGSRGWKGGGGREEAEGKRWKGRGGREEVEGKRWKGRGGRKGVEGKRWKERGGRGGWNTCVLIVPPRVSMP